jgi:hypothetical protein
MRGFKAVAAEHMTHAPLARAYERIRAMQVGVPASAGDPPRPASPAGKR